MTTYESATFSKAAWGAVIDTEFRAWGQACQNAIAGAGLTQVSSTVNWATATVSGVASTFNASDTATYRFNDGLTEVYIKFDWGRGSATAAAVNQFALRVTIGKDSGFAQATTSHYVTGGGTASAVTDYSWHASFGDNCFVLLEEHSLYTSTSNPIHCVIERSRDNDGTVNSNAVVCLMTGNSLNSATAAASAASTQRTMVFTPFAAYTTANATHLTLTNATVTANKDAVAPVVWFYDSFACQMRSLVAIKTSSVGLRQNVTVQRSGVDKPYRAAGLATATFTAASSHKNLYRWE